MSTTKGNNPTTGDSSAMVAAKQEQEQAIVLDHAVRTAATAFGDTFATFAALLDKAVETGVWTIVGFKSAEAYIVDICEKNLPEDLTDTARKALIGMLSQRGLSVRQIATATGASKSQVQRAQVKAENAKDENADNGGPGTRKPTISEFERNRRAMDRAILKVTDNVAEYSREDLSAILKVLHKAAGQVGAQLALAESKSRHPARGRQQQPKQEQEAAAA